MDPCISKDGFGHSSERSPLRFAGFYSSDGLLRVDDLHLDWAVMGFLRDRQAHSSVDETLEYRRPGAEVEAA